MKSIIPLLAISLIVFAAPAFAHHCEHSEAPTVCADGSGHQVVCDLTSAAAEKVMRQYVEILTCEQNHDRSYCDRQRAKILHEGK